MPEMTVEDVLRLMDGMKERGIVEFEGLGLRFSTKPTKKDPRKVGQKLTPRHAADIALERNERVMEEDE